MPSGYQSTPVSFKRVVIYAFSMLLAISSVLALFVDTAGMADASYDEPAASSHMMPDLASVPSYPPPTQVIPTLPMSAPVLLPVVFQWPMSLTYHEAQQDPAYYRTWLEAKNPGFTFRAVHAVVTGYCPCPLCCGSGAHGVTRTGVHTSIEPYGIAGPEALLRHRVHIPGYMFETEPGRVWKTDDTGSALNEDWDSHVYHFDVRFMSHDWAKRWWGRREMTVYLAQPHESP